MSFVTSWFLSTAVGAFCSKNAGVIKGILICIPFILLAGYIISLKFDISDLKESLAKEKEEHVVTKKQLSDAKLKIDKLNLDKEVSQGLENIKGASDKKIEELTKERDALLEQNRNLIESAGRVPADSLYDDTTKAVEPNVLKQQMQDLNNLMGKAIP